MSDLQAALQAAALRIAQAGESPQDVIEAFMQVQAHDLSKLGIAEWFGRFAYVTSIDGFFDLQTRKFIHRKTFDALYRHVKCVSIHDGRPCRPSVAFDESRHAMNGLTAAGITYAPGMGPLCARQGFAECNTWVNGRQRGEPGDCGPWLQHLQRIFPDDAMRRHVLFVLAHKLQRPNVKINSGILLAGVPGCGKDTLFAPFLWALGGTDQRNIAVCRNEDIISAFNYSVESELMIINELRMGAGAGESRALENFLKPALAAPPELIPVNKKQEHPYYALNRTLVVAFSNERRPILLAPDDRRWFVHWTDAPRMTDADAADLWAWYEAGGKAHVAAMLQAYPLDGFNANAAPMMTPAKASLLRAPDWDVEALVAGLASGLEGPFQLRVLATPWPTVCRAVEAVLIARGIRTSVTPAILTRALDEAGWINRGRVAAAGLARRMVYIHPQSPLIQATDTEVRKAAELAWPQTLHLIADGQKKPPG